jgi:hypothetical protein
MIENNEHEKITKTHIKVHVMPNRKNKIRETARLIGLSDSKFLYMCYCFWMEQNKRPL